MESLKKKPSRYSDILGPGFRFHPTDEELVQYYLRRKNCGKSFRFDAISDVDVYKTEPWDLPHMSKLKTRDLEWYFFSLLDKKYGNGARTNRATEKGYWKTTGKDRPVYHKMLSVGWKKTLVYHFGRAPSGSRTNWVMHEYRLADSYLEAAGIAQDAFVVCRIFQKSGTGPKNGEQYGAPLVEEEWDNDELVDSDVSEEVGLGDETILNSCDVQQIVGSDVLLNSAPLPVTLQYADGSYVQETTTASFSGTDMLLVSGANYCDPKLHDDGKNTCYMPASCDADAIPVVQENLGECSKSGNSDNLDFLLDDGPLFELLDDLPNGDVGFVEANDLSNPTETDTVTSDMLDEYLACFDDNDYSSLYLTDPALMFGIEDFASDQTLLPQKEVGEASEQALLQSGPLIGSNISDALLSSDKPEIHQSDLQYGYVQQASKMLGSIPAPPAFAAEFPSKDAVLLLDSVLQSPSPVHVSASTIHIRGRRHDKHQNLNVVLSFGFSRGDDGSSSLESSVSIVPGKAVSSISRGLVYFIFFGVLLLSMSLRIGTFLRVN